FSDANDAAAVEVEIARERNLERIDRRGRGRVEPRHQAAHRAARAARSAGATRSAAAIPTAATHAHNDRDTPPPCAHADTPALHLITQRRISVHARGAQTNASADFFTAQIRNFSCVYSSIPGRDPRTERVRNALPMSCAWNRSCCDRAHPAAG